MQAGRSCVDCYPSRNSSITGASQKAASASQSTRKVRNLPRKRDPVSATLAASDSVSSDGLSEAVRHAVPATGRYKVVTALSVTPAETLQRGISQIPNPLPRVDITKEQKLTSGQLVSSTPMTMRIADTLPVLQ